MGCLMSKPELTVSQSLQSSPRLQSPSQPQATTRTTKQHSNVQDLVDVALDELLYAVSQFSTSHLASDVTSNLTPVASDALQQDPGLLKVLEKNYWCVATGEFTSPVNIRKLRDDLNDYAHRYS